MSRNRSLPALILVDLALIAAGTAAAQIREDRFGSLRSLRGGLQREGVELTVVLLPLLAPPGPTPESAARHLRAQGFLGTPASAAR